MSRIASKLVARSTAGFTLAVGLLIGGCAAPPVVKQSTTTVILMPDEDGNVGAVSVTSDSGAQQINQAYHYATVVGTHSKPSGMSAMGQESVFDAYGGILKAQPPKPKSFILYFLLDRTTLTTESKELLPALLAAVRARKPTEITIFGHADAIGTEKHNFKLSGDRAKMIADLLKRDDPSLDHIDVQYFGDTAPLVPSDARAPEPRNRRAEIMIL